jgi:hypothetical protein
VYENKSPKVVIITIQNLDSTIKIIKPRVSEEIISAMGRKWL